MNSLNRSTQSKQKPERTWGPFSGGSGVAIWLNQLKTKLGLRYFRSVTIQSRRIRDPQTGEWRDAKSFRPTDLPALMLAMEAAQRYMASTPLPGPAVEEDSDVETLADGEVPNDDSASLPAEPEAQANAAANHDPRDIPF